MKLSKDDFDWAVSQGLIDHVQSQNLWNAFKLRTAGTAKFDYVHLAYYAGTVLVVIALYLFLAMNWNQLTPVGTLGISILYATMFGAAGSYLWHKTDLKTPGGLLVTLAVCNAAFIANSLLGLAHLTPPPNAYSPDLERLDWIVMNTSVALTGLLTIRRIRFPFLMAPVAASLWFVALNLNNGGWTGNASDTQSTCTIFGICMLVVAYAIDLRRAQHRDFAFWLYVFGSISLAIGMFDYVRPLSWLVYVSMMVMSILLQRKTLMAVGAVASIAYLVVHYSRLFNNSFYCFGTLTLVGLMVIGLGVYLQRHGDRLRQRIMSAIPAELREFIPNVQ